MGKGFDVIQRSTWGARAPRSRTRRPATTVDMVFIHWPGGPVHIDRTPLPILEHPEEEASDCIMPADLLHLLNTHELRNGSTQAERAYMREIQNFHMNVRGWSDYAYNYALFQSGRVYAGRTFQYVPASQAPFNTHGVSLTCNIGTGDQPSVAMRNTMREFVRWAEKYAGHDLHVKGHRDVNQTSCPGDRLYRLVPSLDRL